jgi:hypothetical protein
MNLAELYEAVYGKSYPCPELFTQEGMRNYLDFKVSHTITSKISYRGELLGCLSGQFKGRAMYIRGGMVNPEWQGRINSKKAFCFILMEYQLLFANKVDYFYGEARTQSAKFHAIFDELEWYPLALLPRKDVFFGSRESEVIYALYPQIPKISTINLTRGAASIASEIVGRELNCSSVKPLGPYWKYLLSDITVNYEIFSQGEGKLKLTLHKAQLSGDVCPISRNVEHVVISTHSDFVYSALVWKMIEEMAIQGLEYVEIYVGANELGRQAILETFGFKATGFLPSWYGPGSSRPTEYLVYTLSFVSEFPDCPLNLTVRGEYLRSFLTPPLQPIWAPNMQLSEAFTFSTQFQEKNELL